MEDARKERIVANSFDENVRGGGDRYSVATASVVVWWCVVSIEMVFLVIPVFLIDYPPMMDLPNHLARLYILSTHDADPVLSNFWHSNWHIVPNLAIDLVGPPLINLTSVVFTSHLILIAIIFLTMAGAITLHRTLFGHRSYWPLLCGLLVYNAIFLAGFLNYLLGVGIALFAASAWVSKAPFLQRHRVLTSIAFSFVLFFCHIMALAFYLVFIGCWQLGRAIEEQLTFEKMTNNLLTLLPAAVFSVVLYLYQVRWAPHHLYWSSIKAKTIYCFIPFLNYSLPLDVVTAVLCVSALALMFHRGALELPTSIKIFLLVSFVIFLLCPQHAGGGSLLDARLPPLIGIVAIAGSRPRNIALRAERVIAIAATVILVARLTVVGAVWTAARRDLQDLQSLETYIPQGARILAVSAEDETQSDELREIALRSVHLPGIWVIDRKVFWPSLFTDVDQQPLKVLPPYDRLSLSGSLPPDYRDLASGELSAETLRHAPYLVDWKDHFDYVVVLLGARAKHLELFDRLPLTLIAKTDIAVLYKIQPSPADRN
jgi:hypothetical protein